MKIKICGICCRADAEIAAAAGADLLGFILYPRSPRYVTPEQIRAMTEGLPSHIERVGVFVNETARNLLTIGRAAGLTTLQLHGEEAPSILPELTEFRLIKAVQLRTRNDLTRLEEYPGCTLLVDTPCAEWGGSGKTGDWSLSAEAARRKPIFLAGGLNPDNVAEAVKVVRPAGIDVSSGVELEKRKKDPERIRAFLRQAREAAACVS